MPETGKPAAPYLVLARKYRPLDFSALIGQDAMVQTLINAFASDRIHHAYILTGVRGVGKTTTARILARAFNYVDKNGPRPTLDLSEQGENCLSIIEGRHVDVMEMDAASNTGIDDIREIIDSVRYGPVSAPYKVYIIDEVHMLSKQAFNGLLKTLEEPPPYVKFIFATTEIRKVPITILSRCQRFDLRRVSPQTMTAHLEDLLKKEKIDFDPDALAMIVRAGEGSVRDCQSLTDQAIAHGNGKIEADDVRQMLGLSDRGLLIDLFEALMAGKIANALELMRTLYDAGADLQIIIAELAEFTHLVTRMKVVAATVDDPSVTPDERKRGSDFGDKLGMNILTRAWQILQSGSLEVGQSGNAIQSAEMVLIRLAYAADIPTPDQIIEKLTEQPPTNGGYPVSSGSPNPVGIKSAARLPMQGGAGAPGSLATNFQKSPDVAPETSLFASPANYAQLVALAGEKRDLRIKHALEAEIRPIKFEPGRLEIALTQTADRTLVSTLVQRLKLWTGRTWMVSLSSQDRLPPTIRENQQSAEQAMLDKALEDPLVAAVIETFPGAEIINVRPLGAGQAPSKQNSNNE